MGDNRLLKFSLFLMVFVAVLVLLGLGKGIRGGNSKPTITASFYPLAHFTKQIVGDNYEVVSITPYGVEPHDFEPTPSDIGKIQSSVLFLYNGGGIDTWAEKEARDIAGMRVKTLGMIYNISDVDRSNGYPDPHFWVSPAIAKKEVEVIRDNMISIDSKNEDRYKLNSGKYIDQLDALDKRYMEGLADCKQRSIIVSHGAFAYLAKRYNIGLISISGLSPDAEPSSKKMGEISSLALARGMKFIFFETLVSPKLAEVIANEVGAKTLVLNPVEGLTAEEEKRGDSYISIMDENLKSLRIAMQCQ